MAVVITAGPSNWSQAERTSQWAEFQYTHPTLGPNKKLKFKLTDLDKNFGDQTEFGRADENFYVFGCIDLGRWTVQIFEVDENEEIVASSNVWSWEVTE